MDLGLMNDQSSNQVELKIGDFPPITHAQALITVTLSSPGFVYTQRELTMKKPLLVTHLLFAGLISVGISNDPASQNQRSPSADSTAHTASYGRAEQNDLMSESRVEATSNPALSLPNSLSTTAETNVWGGDSCSPVPVEVKPCQ
jgi:hypothetical protein